MIGDPNPVIIIDAGHGGSDPGAAGNGIVEKNLVLDITKYQFQRFQELGVKVALTRNSDTTIDSTPRANIVKKSGARYCISNHINSASAASAQGAEIIHSVHNNGVMAKAIANALRAAGQVLRPTPTYSRPNAKGQDYYYMHRQTGAVTTHIVEYGFCTNPEDAARLKQNWKTYGEAVVKACCEYIGHTYLPPDAASIPDQQASIEASIVVNGQEITVKGEVRNGVTYVPVRAVSDALGATVRWDQSSSTVSIDQQ